MLNIMFTRTWFFFPNLMNFIVKSWTSEFNIFQSSVFLVFMLNFQNYFLIWFTLYLIKYQILWKVYKYAICILLGRKHRITALLRRIHIVCFIILFLLKCLKETIVWFGNGLTSKTIVLKQYLIFLGQLHMRCCQ